jgi:hypothetical protein
MSIDGQARLNNESRYFNFRDIAAAADDGLTKLTQPGEPGIIRNRMHVDVLRIFHVPYIIYTLEVQISNGGLKTAYSSCYIHESYRTETVQNSLSLVFQKVKIF